uniref:Uncharacterized protein n=1 Tax=viral metagenome TaxID=1070528 RepID=A0A6M3LYX2_9ZZZZ
MAAAAFVAMKVQSVADLRLLAATTGEAAKSMLAKWRQQNEGNENWTELDDCTVVPLYCDIANQ